MSRFGPIEIVAIITGLLAIAAIIRGLISSSRDLHAGRSAFSDPKPPEMAGTARKEPDRTPPISVVLEPIDHQGIPQTGASIFISYRRDDSGDVAGRIYDRLVQHFGRERVFKDVDSIPLGIDFRKKLRECVSECDVLLAVMGNRWRGEDAQGARIDDERDYVRIEIDAALRREIPVIPVLVLGADAPREENLPDALKPLSYRNGMHVRADPDFHPDMNRLIRGIELHTSSKPPVPPRGARSGDGVK
jgi:TIR domain